MLDSRPASSFVGSFQRSECAALRLKERVPAVSLPTGRVERRTDDAETLALSLHELGLVLVVRIAGENVALRFDHALRRMRASPAPARTGRRG